MKSTSSETFCGLAIDSRQIAEIAEIITTFPNLSRTELANTICELFSWKRPTGKLKSVECRQFLEKLNERGVIALPARREQYVKKTAAKVVQSEKASEYESISGNLKELLPLVLTRVESRQQRQLWYDYVFNWSGRLRFQSCGIWMKKTSTGKDGMPTMAMANSSVLFAGLTSISASMKMKYDAY